MQKGNAMFVRVTYLQILCFKVIHVLKLQVYYLNNTKEPCLTLNPPPQLPCVSHCNIPATK